MEAQSTNLSLHSVLPLKSIELKSWLGWATDILLPPPAHLQANQLCAECSSLEVAEFSSNCVILQGFASLPSWELINFEYQISIITTFDGNPLCIEGWLNLPFYVTLKSPREYLRALTINYKAIFPFIYYMRK